VMPNVGPYIYRRQNFWLYKELHVYTTLVGWGLMEIVYRVPVTELWCEVVATWEMLVWCSSLEWQLLLCNLCVWHALCNITLMLCDLIMRVWRALRSIVTRLWACGSGVWIPAQTGGFSIPQKFRPSSGTDLTFSRMGAGVLARG
jgi:hypothetical protein